MSVNAWSYNTSLFHNYHQGFYLKNEVRKKTGERKISFSLVISMVRSSSQCNVMFLLKYLSVIQAAVVLHISDMQTARSLQGQRMRQKLGCHGLVIVRDSWQVKGQGNKYF